jgi:hypothetical protein
MQVLSCFVCIYISPWQNVIFLQFLNYNAILIVYLNHIFACMPRVTLAATRNAGLSTLTCFVHVCSLAFTSFACKRKTCLFCSSMQRNFFFFPMRSFNLTCKCRKSGVPCSSKCHSGHACENVIQIDN